MTNKPESPEEYFDKSVQAFTMCGRCENLDWCIRVDIEICKKCYVKIASMRAK